MNEQPAQGSILDSQEDSGTFLTKVDESKQFLLSNGVLRIEESLSCAGKSTNRNSQVLQAQLSTDLLDSYRRRLNVSKSSSQYA